MAKLKIIGSGSSGNCYLLQGINEDLLLETGGYKLTWKKIKKALNYDLSRISYCLLSHEHKDHAGNIQEILDYPIPVFSSNGTMEALSDYTVFDWGGVVETEEFKITRFKVEHDAVDPQGFMIESKTEFIKIVFITDSKWCEYDFSDEDIDYFMLEVNYQEDLLKANCLIDSNISARADRVRNSHFELGNAIDFLNASKSAKTKAIIPLHMSSDNLDLDFAKDIIEKKTGIECLFDREIIEL